MESLSNAVRVNLANYIANLPIPNTVGGIFKLSARDWVNLLPAVGFVTYVGYVSYRQFSPIVCSINPCTSKCTMSSEQVSSSSSSSSSQHVNLTVDKKNPKIVHQFDMEDLGDQVTLCRCWRSKKFPYCDGSHNNHNKETGDNVGPIVIKKKK